MKRDKLIFVIFAILSIIIMIIMLAIKESKGQDTTTIMCGNMRLEEGQDTLWYNPNEFVAFREYVFLGDIYKYKNKIYFHDYDSIETFVDNDTLVWVKGKTVKIYPPEEWEKLNIGCHNYIYGSRVGNDYHWIKIVIN